MAAERDIAGKEAPAGLLTRLMQDRAGNTLAMIAAGIFPLLAMVGGGVDMGRTYLSQSRLQQACDSGVLAARKKLGSAVVLDGEVPGDVSKIGERFFSLNFGDGAYGTINRSFEMTLESDYAISGEAHVDVPTSIMNLFGYDEIAVDVACSAKLNFSNMDVMFVLDTTGSMLDKATSGDPKNKIDTLRDVVKSFHTQIEASKTPGTRVRYGFLPYSTNVNVGTLLKSDWVVADWDYHGRQAKSTGVTYPVDQYQTDYTYISGTQVVIPSYTTTGACPPYSVVWTSLASGTNPDGSTYGTNQLNGDDVWCNVSADGASRTVSGWRYTNYTYSWVTKKTGTVMYDEYKWQYKLVNQSTTPFKGATGNDVLKTGMIQLPMYGYPSPTPANLDIWFNGCIEERDTYEIDDYSAVDLTKAIDLDIDLVPSPGNTPEARKTQWRPLLGEISFEPEIWWDGTGTFSKVAAATTNDYLMARWAGTSACPSPAQKLQEMDASAVSGYVDSLVAEGSTYHDIGMIWGGRLLSPTGIFAGENADVAGKPTSRHMIFLTDGETAPLDLSYGTYGIEPLDTRRWDPKKPEGNLTLAEVVEKRFGVACSEVKKRNITVWVIGFGVSLNPVMTDCAGPGHSFEATNAAELEDVFAKIATQLGDLRISK
ncbi:VWA domain-containing protein [Novosphingobium sp. B 225]|uniref:VWA domain-containing protein n=1 Tax=Novosphingobium sp. B 225 TaxID=1961849 RepID=UPI000B4BEE7B|nr:VWA domain-containing protein [Novosphingobium sp. B 225]